MCVLTAETQMLQCLGLIPFLQGFEMSPVSTETYFSANVKTRVEEHLRLCVKAGLKV